MRRALNAIRGIGFPTNAVLPGDGDVIAIDDHMLRGACDKGQSAGQGARARMMVSACAVRLRLTLAADRGGRPIMAANWRR